MKAVALLLLLLGLMAMGLGVWADQSLLEVVVGAIVTGLGFWMLLDGAEPGEPDPRRGGKAF